MFEGQYKLELWRRNYGVKWQGAILPLARIGTIT